MEASSLCVRQSWTRKRTRHTRRLAKRFIRLECGVLKSFKKAPFDISSTATCQWQVKGASISAAPIPGHLRGHWQLLFACGGQDECIEFVFENGRVAQRWVDWLKRASLHGSLHASLAMLPYRDVQRTIRGAELPGYMRPMAYVLGDSAWTREVEVVDLGTMRTPFLELELVLRPHMPPAIAYVLVVEVQGAESHVRFRPDPLTVGECVAAWAKPLRDDVLCVRVPVLTKIDQMDVLSFKLFKLATSPTDSNIFSMISKATIGSRNGGVCTMVAKWALPMSDVRLYTRLGGGPTLTTPNDPVIIQHLHCTVPWWHVFEGVAPEPTPLLSEYSLTSWQLEVNKLITLFNRLCHVFSSFDWITTFEQPPATIALVLYATVCVWWLPGHFITLLVLVPMCVTLIIRCPYLQQLQLRTLLSAPILLALTHIDQLRWNRPKDIKANKHAVVTSVSPVRELLADDTLPQPLRCLMVSTVPIECEPLLHQGLLDCPPAKHYLVRPYLSRSLRGLITLFLLSVYGGLPTHSVDSAKDAFKILRNPETERRKPYVHIDRHEHVSFGRWIIQRLSIWQVLQVETQWRSFCLSILASENSVPNKEQIVSLRPSTSSAVSTSEEEDDAWGSMSQGSEPEAAEPSTSTHEGGGYEGFKQTVKYLQEKRPYWRIKDIIDTMNGPGLFPADTLETGADSDEDELVLAQQLSRHRERKGAGGIRGIVKDAASVFRVIIDYRKGIEKVLNMFSWAHPLGTMTITILLIVLIFVSPWVSWPLLIWFDALAQLRRLYQKAAWKRNARILLHTQYAIAQAAKGKRSRDSGKSKHGGDGDTDTMRPADLVETVIAGSEDFAKGPARVPTARGWFCNIIYHTLYSDELINMSGQL